MDEVEHTSMEHSHTVSDLALALRRIDALQAALNANSDIDEEDERDELLEDELKLLDQNETHEEKDILKNGHSPKPAPPVQSTEAPLTA